jgi:hypothetical protein
MTCDQPQSRSNNILGIQYKLMLAVEGWTLLEEEEDIRSRY